MKTVEEIRTILRAHQPELKKSYNVEEIALFGSYARGDQTDGSDLDILVTLNAPLGWEFVDLCDHLAELLETKVDVLTKGAVDQEAVASPTDREGFDPCLNELPANSPLQAESLGLVDICRNYDSADLCDGLD